jgi:hypothetical protein
MFKFWEVTLSVELMDVVWGLRFAERRERKHESGSLEGERLSECKGELLVSSERKVAGFMFKVSAARRGSENDSSRQNPHPSPLPEDEGKDRGLLERTRGGARVPSLLPIAICAKNRARIWEIFSEGGCDVEGSAIYAFWG